MTRTLCLGLLVACLVGCGASVEQPVEPTVQALLGPDEIRAVRYLVSVDSSLSLLTAEVCFDGAASDTLLPLNLAAFSSLRAATSGGRDLVVSRERGIVLEQLANGCAEYRVDLVAAANSRMSGRSEDATMANPTELIWYPARLDLRVPVTVRFALPDGIDVAVPWEREGDVYRLDSTIEIAGSVVFGRFDRVQVDVPHGVLDVVVVGDASEVSVGLDGIAEWLREAGRAVATFGGRFPRERAMVVVMPIFYPGRDPVGFGMVRRGGGASVLLLMNARAEREALIRDWTAVHEFSHLFLPRLRQRDVWISEGFATYAQEILRARAGLISEQEAYQHLYNGMSRQRSRYPDSLGVAAERMHETRGYQRIYWAGAAFMMELDQRLRRAGSSLDEAVLSARGAWSREESWDGLDCLRAFDASLSRPVAIPFAEQTRASNRFPSFRGVLRQLGVTSERGTVSLAPNETRTAIAGSRP